LRVLASSERASVQRAPQPCASAVRLSTSKVSRAGSKLIITTFRRSCSAGARVLTVFWMVSKIIGHTIWHDV
jgi:hypothetical protein